MHRVTNQATWYDERIRKFTDRLKAFLTVSVNYFSSTGTNQRLLYVFNRQFMKASNAQIVVVYIPNHRHSLNMPPVT